MASTTVAQLAAELNRPAAALLEQLQSAGVKKASTDDTLSESDKERLLDFLRTSHGTAGAERKKITLTRKSTSEIKQADSSGKARTIQVEVRKKRTFVKRDDAPAAEETAAPVIDEAELQRREEEARAQAELLRRQEEDLAEKRRLREEQEQRDREAAEARAAEAARKAAEETAAALAAAAAKPEPKGAGKAGAAPAEAAPAAAAPAAPAEPVKPALRVIKAADVANEEVQRAADLAKRRKAAEDEAKAIREMMNAPKKVLVAKKPEEPPKPATEIKGTIHKKAGAPGAPATTTAGAAKPGDKKSVKSEKLSSSWADDAAKKRTALKGRTDGAAGGARAGWRAPRGGRRGERSDGSMSSFVAPAEQQVQEVHIPETISVADLAHKMSVKASEVIKQLMKLGQMVTINQQLDQETAMIVVEEMG
ncbi:MAG TPA: translation initiation factor IF-2 N-terminal domain-containing protein, partial [Piscinibacter sp.]|nr:translation initiation factor IF-2 N-terminal domain-containing protein [Piscinibacter sp.]HPG79600.1 translation initiation factor IF-2 N-terminal domain-containing protein [Piscinibacter sp.]